MFINSFIYKTAAIAWGKFISNQVLFESIIKLEKGNITNDQLV